MFDIVVERAVLLLDLVFQDVDQLLVGHEQDGDALLRVAAQLAGPLGEQAGVDVVVRAHVIFPDGLGIHIQEVEEQHREETALVFPERAGDQDRIALRLLEQSQGLGEGVRVAADELDVLVLHGEERVAFPDLAVLDAPDDLPRVLALDRDGDHLRPLVAAGQRVLFPLGAQVDDRLYSQVVQPDGIPFAQVADLAGTEDLSPFGGLAFRVRVTAQVADILHAVHHDGARAHDMPVLPVEVEAEVFPVEIVVRDVGRYAILDIDIFGGRPVETGGIVGDRDADRPLHAGSDFPFQDIIPDLVPLAIGMNGGLVG